MTAITKSGLKMKPRLGMRFFKMIFLLLMLGTTCTVVKLHLAISENAAIENRAVTSPSSAIQKPQEKILRKVEFPHSNEEYFHNPSVNPKKKMYIYHHTPGTPDHTEGVIILDMLLGHVYAYNQGAVYGGSCGDGNDVLRGPETKLIEAIGLQDFLQFACPRDFETMDRKKVIPVRSYTGDGTRAFTPEYVNLLKKVIQYPKKDESLKTNTIVVHIRRGRKNFTPCKKKKYHGFDPYLPNKHYQLLIDKYSKEGYENKVVIYSQSNSFETFDEFRDKGYKLHLDEDMADVWKAVLKSDVFIMSRSSFSFVPAMMANNSTKVVYTPYWEQPLRDWSIVRKDIQSQSDEEVERLRSTCKKKGKK